MPDDFFGEFGTPKYQTPQDIRDALEVLSEGEEINLLSEMFSDVSQEGQEYYYVDGAYKMREKFDELSDCGRQMWRMDLAIWQMSENREIHDLVYDALSNSELAKALGFRKLFIEHMLRGDKSLYVNFSEAWRDELSELNRFEYHANWIAFEEVLRGYGHEHWVPTSGKGYNNFLFVLRKKAEALDLRSETRIIAESRALLNSYDDFILGLKMNKALHDGLEQQYRAKMAALQSAYDEKVKQLTAGTEHVALPDFIDIKPIEVMTKEGARDDAGHD
ncbi:hypothetical protein FACS1894187_10490 [Synergistales bacterium]|nr:hypothetical protein FACS1894187_10490 [Synergistales bacterium]